jgi:hypothetical protein
VVHVPLDEAGVTTIVVAATLPLVEVEPSARTHSPVVSDEVAALVVEVFSTVVVPESLTVVVVPEAPAMVMVSPFTAVIFPLVPPPNAPPPKAPVAPCGGVPPGKLADDARPELPEPDDEPEVTAPIP